MDTDVGFNWETIKDTPKNVTRQNQKAKPLIDMALPSVNLAEKAQRIGTEK